MVTNPTPAAQYLRMSTEHQQYSIENQASAIQRYAERHGFEVVHTYVDAGKSGVVLKRRTGLQQLLKDVVGGSMHYGAVLVYDISRWGRFQDADEAAHYEFLCKRAGAPVHYCAEPFQNDATLPSAIFKALKRTMAGEFSRELGVKVFEGKSRLAMLGFRVGGTPGYGLRRLLLGADGQAKQVLGVGEHKYVATQRTVLVPGPKEEVEVVQQIFRMALTTGPSNIVRFLNECGIKTDTGGLWKYSKLRNLLSNPKYVGCNAWGRTAQKLRGRKVMVTPEQWATRSRAFEPVVTQELFDQVQVALLGRYRRPSRYTDAHLLECLRALLAKEGKLTQRMILASSGHSNTTYRLHFGSLQRVYEAVGFSPSPETFARTALREEHRRLRDQLQHSIVDLNPEHLSACVLGRSRRHAIRVDGQFTLPIVVCKGYVTAAGKDRWQLAPPAEQSHSVILLCLARPAYQGFSAYYLVPGIDKPRTYQIKSEHDPWLSRGQRLSNLAQLYEVAVRMRFPTPIEK